MFADEFSDQMGYTYTASALYNKGIVQRRPEDHTMPVKISVKLRIDIRIFMAIAFKIPLGAEPRTEAPNL